MANRSVLLHYKSTQTPTGYRTGSDALHIQFVRQQQPSQKPEHPLLHNHKSDPLLGAYDHFLDLQKRMRSVSVHGLRSDTLGNNYSLRHNCLQGYKDNYYLREECNRAEQ